MSRIEHLLTSPDLRCRQTLEPLAAQRGLPVRFDARLASGRSATGALALLAEVGSSDVVLCSHGDLIPRVIERFCEEGLRLERELVCDKGSVWVVEGEPGRRARARYVPPPAKSREPGLAGIEIDDPAPLESEKQRVAVLDLGSTSFHLLVADATPSGEIRRVLREREMLRLGASRRERRADPGRGLRASGRGRAPAAPARRRRAREAGAGGRDVGPARCAQRASARPPDRRRRSGYRCACSPACRRRG